MNYFAAFLICVLVIDAWAMIRLFIHDKEYKKLDRAWKANLKAEPLKWDQEESHYYQKQSKTLIKDIWKIYKWPDKFVPYPGPETTLNLVRRPQ